MAAYAAAHSLGVAPQPGEALLRCSLGDVDTAWNEIQVAIAAADERGRAELLAGAVEIACARSDFDSAERYLRELDVIGAPDALLHAQVLVGRGRFSDALAVLRVALREYRLRGLQTETAQAYRWMAVAHRGLGADDLAAADEAAAGLHGG